jgi:ribonuclease-3
MRFGIVKPGTGDAQNEQAEITEPIKFAEEDLNRLESELGYKFAERALLERALTHRSVPTKGNSKNDYERLEFLGDAVLDLAVAHLLLDAHPEAREGELSKMRAALVNTASLAEIAKRINLSPCIRLSRGELANGGAARPSILADVFEAIMGAIYREAGFEIALRCVTRLFGDLISTVKPRDPKTELQEALHTTGSTAPEYLLECVEGPEHAPVFVSVVKVDGQIVGRGRGATKKASQQAAASQALERLNPADEIDKKFIVQEQSVPKEDE